MKTNQKCSIIFIPQDSLCYLNNNPSDGAIVIYHPKLYLPMRMEIVLKRIFNGKGVIFRDFCDERITWSKLLLMSRIVGYPLLFLFYFLHFVFVF